MRRSDAPIMAQFPGNAMAVAHAARPGGGRPHVPQRAFGQQRPRIVIAATFASADEWVLPAADLHAIAWPGAGMRRAGATNDPRGLAASGE